MDLLVIGTVALDDIETPYGTRKDIVGGSATYFSYAASFFTTVGVVGAVGGDFPAEYLDLLRSREIDLSGLEVLADKQSFHWAGRYEGSMESAQTLSTDLNVLENYRPVVPEGSQKTSFAFLANAEPSLQLSVLDQLEGTRFLVCDTMNLWINNYLDGLKQVFARVDGIVINEGEAVMLTGIDNVVAAADALLEMGPHTVIIKRGGHGSFLRCREGRFAIPAYPLTAVKDPTGAGDSFAGGFMGYLASRKSTAFADLKRAMAYGTVVASFDVEDFSLDSFRRIQRCDIESRLGQFEDYVRF